MPLPWTVESLGQYVSQGRHRACVATQTSHESPLTEPLIEPVSSVARLGQPDAEGEHDRLAPVAPPQNPGRTAR